MISDLDIEIVKKAARGIKGHKVQPSSYTKEEHIWVHYPMKGNPMRITMFLIFPQPERWKIWLADDARFKFLNMSAPDSLKQLRNILKGGD